MRQPTPSDVHRHSGVSQASITVECQETEVRVTISDNGKGFELPQQLSNCAGQGELGVTGMAERARLAGGELKVSSQKGKGTKIIVKTPTKLYSES